MKKQAFTKKLVLATETVHVLAPAELAGVGGGGLAMFYPRSNPIGTAAINCYASASPLTVPCKVASLSGLTVPCRVTL